jgi:3-hydroxybutyryl-CoA dehydrogenase
MDKIKIGVLGAGSMGSGIAQVAATAGHMVVLIDNNEEQLGKAKNQLNSIILRLIEKGKLSEKEGNEIFGRIQFTTDNGEFASCGMIIEAILENLDIKKKVFYALETIVSEECILATNTSSLSVASIASAVDKPERVIGIHFFNPAPLMPLVEIVPAITTSNEVTSFSRSLIDSWKKVTVLTKDLPGFIVNRVARPFYGEAIRIYEEGIADFATIDWAMKELGNFRMGPFELMDYIGNDINYTVTETVFKEFFYDPRFKPSFTQKRMMEAGLLGRKTGRGYYSYQENATNPSPNMDKELGEKILFRILVMLINEAVDALYLNVASKEDLDLAMTKGVNYPKGLLQWADEIGVQKVYNALLELHETYLEDRYRPSVLLRKMAESNSKFF